MVTPPKVAIAHATCLMGPDLTALPDAVVVVGGDSVESVGAFREARIESDVQVVDATGLTLVPGFIDAHVHVGFYDPRAIVSGGVTAVRDLGWPPERIWSVVRRSNDPDFAGPTVVAAGQILTARGGYPTRAAWAPPGTGLEIEDERRAREAVERTADAGASVIKIALNRDAGPTLDVSVVRAIADAAHRRDLPVTGHVVGLPELDKALSGGVDELAHMLLSPVLIPQRTLARMAAQDMTIVPTLSIFFGRAQRVAVKNLRRWIDAGGRVVYGTDLGNTGPRPGIERREVSAMAKSGMSPKDIVRSATVVAARCIGLGRAGSIEAGCSADLVALRGDPLTDARAITNVAHVWRRGRRVR